MLAQLTHSLTPPKNLTNQHLLVLLPKAKTLPKTCRIATYSRQCSHDAASRQLSWVTRRFLLLQLMAR